MLRETVDSPFHLGDIYVARLGIASVQPMWKQPAMRIVLAWYWGPRKKNTSGDFGEIIFLSVVVMLLDV